MKNRSQDRGRAGFHPRAWREWPCRPAPLPSQTLCVSPARPGGDRGRGEARERGGERGLTAGPGAQGPG
ncbi:hypothetical protein NN561_000367 [Cricetulus griseus]